MNVMKSLRTYHSFAMEASRCSWLAAGLLLCIAGRDSRADETPPTAAQDAPAAESDEALNQKADGYRGIWYMNQPVNNEYQYKYSGGLGTYCDYHSPFSVYRPEVNRTFFCYGGAPEGDSRQLLHMVSYFDHKTGTVPRPTLLLNKHTNDAHDNPVMAIDKDGFIWIFSTAHGVGRPAYIHRSKKPYDIDEFERVSAVRREGKREIPIDNFSYFQIFYDKSDGFRAIFTRYNYPAARTACFMSSADGVHWSEWQRLAAIEEGHYQIGAAGQGKIATMLNMHPHGKGLNWRTNLYYIESTDNGKTWHAADGTAVHVPLTTAANPALVRNYAAEELLVYLKDLQFDRSSRPVMVFSTSRGFEPGPENGARTLSIAKWDGKDWQYHDVTTTDHNYDSAFLSFDDDGTWRIIGPTDPGPQPFGTGGEMAVWLSSDQGATWRKEKQLTAGSQLNQSYARRPVNANPEFFALWADGNARQPSESHLYFCDAKGSVYQLPPKMEGDSARPQLVTPHVASFGGN